MAQTKGVMIAVKVPIKWESMTKRTRQRLRQIVGRDTRIIRSFLGIIEQYENQLLTGRKRNRINDGELDKLTLTALRVNPGYSPRLAVPHNMKAKFPRISTNELQECRQTAVFMYESYLELRRKKGRKASRPCVVNGTRRIPRWVFSQRFKIFKHKTSEFNWWLDLRDSLDSVIQGRKVHDRLFIPLSISPFHLNQMAKGNIKALQLFTDRNRKWWAIFSVSISDVPELPDNLPPAVLGIDLGIEKAVCTALVTPTKVRETRYFYQNDKAKEIKILDHRVSDLQHDMHTRSNNELNCDKITRELRTLRGKRERVAREYDRVLVKQLTDYILELSEKCTLYVSLGKLTNIRTLAKRGNYKGRRFRGMIHSWAFARITDSLKHRLSQLGFPTKGKDSRFKVVPENWTSIMCWKCGHKGHRPKQNYFVCDTCGHRTNADRNGAINIAGRLIMLTKSLHSVRGLGKWLDSVQRAGKQSRLKTRGKIHSSRRESLLSSKGQVSDLGESAAFHSAQTSLLDFGDGIKESDQDYAVGKDAETLSVTGSDTTRVRQEKEARTVGGMPSR
jgi:transposase